MTFIEKMARGTQSGVLRPSRYTILRRNWKEYLLPTWQICIAVIAILDIWNAWSSIIGAWAADDSDARSDDQPEELPTTPAFFANILDKLSRGNKTGGDAESAVAAVIDDDTCTNLDPNVQIDASLSECGIRELSSPYYPFWLLPSSLYYLGNDYIGPIFCILCVVNGILRAKRAQQLAYENAALDVFESKLAKICSLSRTSFMAHHHSHTNLRRQPFGSSMHLNNTSRNNTSNYDNMDQELARKTLRIWGPTAAQLTLWFVIIPWSSCWCFRTFFVSTMPSTNESSSIYSCYNDNNFSAASDSALMTTWTVQFFENMQRGWKVIETAFWSTLWKRVRHVAFHSPIKLILKIKQIFRWIRFIRYAGPLLRMLDKVQNHTRDLIHTWRQSRALKRNKMKKISNKADLQQDIRRIASVERLNQFYRKRKSQLFKLIPEQYQKLLQRTVGDSLAKEKRNRDKIKRRVDNLTMSAGNSWANLGEVYDQLVDLTQEVKATVQKDVLYDHLIPPNTKFSVAWRAIVSGSLLLELIRLWLSWKANGDFTVSLEQLLRQWFVTCDRLTTQVHKHHNITKLIPEKAREFFVNSGKFLTFGGKFHLLENKQKDKDLLEQCLMMDVSYSATLAQQIGKCAGIAIDLVNFLDIFVWFNTGQIDPETGLILPKPFFSRCIVPGTLVQVFDHPTLPTVLPMLFVRFLRISKAVGYSRVVRWGLVLEPACTLLIVDPLKAYWLSPAIMENKSFASMGFLSPETAAAMDDGYGFASLSHGMEDGSNWAMTSDGSLSAFGAMDSSVGHLNIDKPMIPKGRRDSVIFNQSFVY